MQHRTSFLVFALLAFTLSCKRPDFIRLQPTIEEPPSLAAFIRISDPAGNGQLLRGFYALEDNSWRWTGPKFSVALGVPPSALKNGAWLVLKFDLPDALLAAVKKLTLTATVGSTPLAPQTFAAAGPQEYRRDVPLSAFKHDSVNVNFSLDKSYAPPGDGRELGVVVTAVGLEPK